MSRYLLSFLALVLTWPASAAIYRYTDARGNQVYTNQPPDGQPAEAIQLQNPNLIAPPGAAPAPAVPEAGVQQGYELRVAGVADGSSLRSNTGDLLVSVETTPALRQGHVLVLLLDGKAVAEPGRVTSFPLSGLDRGEHSLQAVVSGAEGEVQRSAAVHFTLQRSSLNSPVRRGQ